MLNFFKNIKIGKSFKCKNNAGVTLVEIIVVIFIIVLFSAIVISDYPAIQRRLALSRATYKLAQDFRKIEDFGFSGITIKDGNNKPVKAIGYGIYFDRQGYSSRYILYANVADPYVTRQYDGTFSTPLCSAQTDPDGVQADCPIEIVDIGDTSQGGNPSLYIKAFQNNNNVDLTAYRLSINFMPPNPTVTITDFSNTYSAGIKIVLTDSTTDRKVFIATSGLINIAQ